MEQKFSTAFDVYAFGVIMWEISSLRLPYQGLPQAAIVERISGGRPPEPHDYQYLPSAWTTVMRQCWAMNCEDRPPFSEISQALAACPGEVNFNVD